MDSSQDCQYSRSSEQNFSQESDIMTTNDIKYVIDDLGSANNLSIYFEEPEIPVSSEFVHNEKFQNTCDSVKEEVHYFDQIKNYAVNPSSPTGRLPCTDSYLGPYNFELCLDGTTSHKKSWVYSHVLNKVFIDMNKVLLIQFHLNAPGPGLRVRALLVYTVSDFLNQPVNRCTLHTFTVDPHRQAHAVDGKCFCAQYKWAGHVLQTDQSNAEYNYNPESERHSVVVPLQHLEAGTDTFVVPYRFTCKTSCTRGMQRRPADVIFTLETSQGEVIGRQSISVKICSCPKRDKEREEKDAEWVQNDRGVSRPGKRSMTSHETVKKLKAEVTTETCVDSHKKDNSYQQDIHDMVKRAEELNKDIQCLQQVMAQNAAELATKSTELTRIIVELGRISSQKKV